MKAKQEKQRKLQSKYEEEFSSIRHNSPYSCNGTKKKSAFLSFYQNMENTLASAMKKKKVDIQVQGKVYTLS